MMIKGEFQICPRIDFLQTSHVQVLATMKVDLFSRTKKCGSQEGFLMHTRHKCIPVSKPTSIKSTIQHDV